MTAVEARAYAERQYVEIIEPVSIMSSETAALVKERIAHAYMDGAIEVLGAFEFKNRVERDSQHDERGNDVQSIVATDGQLGVGA